MLGEYRGKWFELLFAQSAATIPTDTSLRGSDYGPES